PDRPGADRCAVVEHAVTHRLDGARRGGREAIPAGGAVDRPGRAERADREIVTVRLLPHEEAILCPPAREDAGGDVERGIDLEAVAREHPPPGAGGTPNRLLHAVAEPAQALLGQRAAEPGHPSQVWVLPRAIAISPVRTISTRPNGRTMLSNASILSAVPVTSIVTVLPETSMMRARKMS